MLLALRSRKARAACQAIQALQSCRAELQAHSGQLIVPPNVSLSQKAAPRTFLQAAGVHCQSLLLAQPVQQPDPASTDTKTCSACKIAKPHADYWKRQASLDGLQLACKDCMKQHASQLRHDRRYWQPYNGLMQCCDCEQVKYAKHFAKRIGTVQGAQYECRECNRKRLSEAYQQKKQANPQPTVQTKVCRSCQMQKASSAFHKHVMHKDGLQSHCIGCQVSRRHNFVRSFIL